jgi:hypothetical protein
LFKRHPELPETVVTWFANTPIKTPGRAPADAVASAAILNQIESPRGVAPVTERDRRYTARRSRAAAAGRDQWLGLFDPSIAGYANMDSRLAPQSTGGSGGAPDANWRSC